MSVIFLAVVGVFAIWFLATDYATKTAVYGTLGDRYKELSEEWRELWYKESSQSEVNALRVKYNRLSASYNNYEDNDKLNNQAFDKADQLLVNEFGGS